LRDSASMDYICKVGGIRMAPVGTAIGYRNKKYWCSREDYMLQIPKTVRVLMTTCNMSMEACEIQLPCIEYQPVPGM